MHWSSFLNSGPQTFSHKDKFTFTHVIGALDGPVSIDSYIQVYKEKAIQTGPQTDTP
jgi:hypothetical protein